MIKQLKGRLAEAGKIKIGGLGEARRSRAGVEYRMPVSYGYFAITTTRREDPQDPRSDLVIDKRIMNELSKTGHEDQDGHIRRLPIALHSDDIEEVFSTAYVCYHGKRLACRGDGEKAMQVIFSDGEMTGKKKEVKCPCHRLEPDDKGVRRCKASGVLHCSIRLPGMAVAGAIHRWRTTSIISCEQMIGSLKQILYYAGALQGLPLLLVVDDVRVSPDGQSQKTVHVCRVELREELLAAQRAALEHAKARSELAGELQMARVEGYRAMLRPPGTEDELEQAEVADEFYSAPEVIDAEVVDEITDDIKEKLAAPATPRARQSEVIGEPQEPPAAPTPPARPKTPTAGRDGPPECPGEPHQPGTPRRSKCKGGGGLYPKDRLNENGFCSHCMPRPQADRVLTSCPKCERKVYQDELIGEVCSFCDEATARRGSCSKCGEVMDASKLQGGICGECTEHPEQGSAEQCAANRQEWIEPFFKFVKAGKIDPNSYLQKLRDRYPELEQRDKEGDYSMWTSEVKNEAIGMLLKEAGEM